jgi:hypothetical protein
MVRPSPDLLRVGDRLSQAAKAPILQNHVWFCEDHDALGSGQADLPKYFTDDRELGNHGSCTVHLNDGNTLSLCCA